MEFPEVLKQDIEAHKAVLSLLVSADNVYFKGHFEQAPIVPGVAQIHWALFFAKQCFINMPEPVVKDIKALKFQQVIQPSEELTLKLEYDEEKHVLNFSFSSTDTRYSSGKVSLTYA